MDKPNIGDTVYYVIEHYYHQPGAAAARMEYMPVAARVKRFINGGYKEAEIAYKVDAVTELSHPKLSDFGRTRWDNYPDAVEAAARAAKEYDRHWEGIDGERLRRPWEEGMVDAKEINGHIYERRFEGREVYYVDFKQFIDPAEAAKALGVSINEFLGIAEVEIDGD